MKLFQQQQQRGGIRTRSSSSILLLLRFSFLLTFGITICNAQNIIPSSGFLSLLASSFEIVNDILPYCSTSPDAINLFLQASGRDTEATADQYCINDVNGKERCYYLLIPTCVTSGSVPLIIDMHAYLSCPLYNALYTEWLDIALDECMVVAWPIGNQEDTTLDCFHVPGGAEIDGSGSTIAPDCCCQLLGDEPPPNTDDLVFIEMIIDDANEQLITESGTTASINLQKVIVTGHSNGGIAATAFGAQYSNRVSCIASFAGSYITEFAKDYIPVPLWMVHGTNDNIINYNGIDSILPSAPNAAKFWSTQNNCQAMTSETIPSGVFEPGAITTTMYSTCDDTKDVKFISIDGGDHFPYPRFEEYIGLSPGSTTYPTTQDAWDFCKTFTSEYVPPVVEEEEEEEEGDYPCPTEERCIVQDIFGNTYEGTTQYVITTNRFFRFLNRCDDFCTISDVIATTNEQLLNYKCGACP